MLCSIYVASSMPRSLVVAKSFRERTKQRPAHVLVGLEIGLDLGLVAKALPVLFEIRELVQTIVLVQFVEIQTLVKNEVDVGELVTHEPLIIF